MRIREKYIKVRDLTCQIAAWLLPKRVAYWSFAMTTAEYTEPEEIEELAYDILGRFGEALRK